MIAASRRVSMVLFGTLLVLTAGFQASAAEPTANRLGRKIDNFTLRDYRGASQSLDELADQQLVVIAFLGTECPLAKLYAPRLSKLHEEFSPRGVAFLGINANQQDSITEIGQYAKSHGIEFPILKDVGNAVADQLSAVRTPEVFVLDRERVVRYWGRIDDQYGVGIQRTKATRHDLKAAITELLAGQEVSQPAISSVGCRIGRVAKSSEQSEVTYSNQIARILQNRCLECHRAGEIAPFSLTSYGEVAGWAETIAEVVEEGRMPPWHANPQYGHFINDARLSTVEKDLILRWVRAGAPEGEKRDLPAPREYVQGWRIPKPDQIVWMSEKPYGVPAEGEVRYQYFTADPGFTEDKWIRAAECQPGNREVVHHIIVGIVPPDGRRRSTGGDLDSDWLSATAPGARPLMLADGLAKRVPAGSKLVFQMHYTPNGKAQTDRSSVGLVFADPKTVRKEVGTWKAATQRLAIPPHAENHRVESWHEFGKDSILLSLFPHMHLRGKAFRYVAHYPDGKQEILLDVPRYDFNWQNAYEFSEPKRLPAGTRLQCIAHFDNSANNPANPNPEVTVRWGDQTWEEMMIGYFDMALADQDLLVAPEVEVRRTQKFLDDAAKSPPQLDEKLRAAAAKAMESNEAFLALGVEARRVLPQLDRICLTVVEGDKLRVERDAQEPQLRSRIGGRGISVAASRMALAEYANGQKEVLNQDLSQVSNPDIRMLGRALSSSFHAPVEIDGRKGTINFWSREAEAFPPQAVELVKELARLMAK